jgi:hypothetical protein
MELPSEESIRWIVRHYAEWRAAHGEVLGAPELIEPSGRHFPDEFTKDAPSIARLLRRMTTYAPLSSELSIELAFIDAEESSSGGGCGKSACGTGGAVAAYDGVVDIDDGYRVMVKVADVSNPVLLTTSLARSIGSMVLVEAGEEVSSREAAIASELAATMCGFGVLLLAGSAVYTKACGGLRMHAATVMSVPELALSLALFLRVHDVDTGKARAHLETTQREAFAEALRWVDSNEALVTALRDRPLELADGLFVIEPVRGLLGRLFSRRRADPAPSDVVATSQRARRTERTDAELRRLAEAKALVEEALGTD